MNKNAPEILQLRLDIEHNVSRRIRTPYDFEFLAGAIWERLHENISPTTLKRLWGYIDGSDTTRRVTLCLLARFLGYDDWEQYQEALTQRSDIDSATFVGAGIHTLDLEKGQSIEVTWLPNRRCVFRYEGENQFTVTQAENAKLQVGDTFSCTHFLQGQPMYLDHLVQAANQMSTPSISYVAGSRSGLVSVRVIADKR